MLVYNVFGFYVVLLFYAKPTVSEETSKAKSNDNAVHHSFVKLLKSIVKVNEERMDAVKKITQLQDYMITKNRLNPYEDSIDTEEEEEPRAIYTIDDPRSSKIRRTEDETVTLKLCSQMLLKNNVRLWTNDFFKHACPVRSSESCIEACVKTFLGLCENFSCKPALKSNFRHQCETNCVALFEQEDHDEEE